MKQPSDFVFVGESLALDLVNTEVVVRGKSRDLLETAADLNAWWRAARSLHADAGMAPIERLAISELAALLDLVKQFRDVLRPLCEAVIAGRPIAPASLVVLDRILGSGYDTVGIDATGRPRAAIGVHGSGPDGALLPIARSALTLLTQTDLSRLHRCANDRCVLLFFDTTRSATRRWCSVGCMNRARSSRRYREGKATRAAAAPEPSTETGR